MNFKITVVADCLYMGKRARISSGMVIGEYAICPECGRLVIQLKQIGDTLQVLTDPSHPILLVEIAPADSAKTPDVSSVQDRLL